MAPTPIPPEPPLPRGVGDVLSVLRSIAVVVDASDAVVNTSASAVSYGLVRHGELVHHELRHLARQVRRDGMIREAQLDLTRSPNTTASVVMRVRVAPIAVSHVLILAEDHTHARRVEEIRRDFVANVSHELKTPVGGISLLAEAVLGRQGRPRGGRAVRQAHPRRVHAADPAGPGDRRPVAAAGRRHPARARAGRRRVGRRPRRSTGSASPPRAPDRAHPGQPRTGCGSSGMPSCSPPRSRNLVDQRRQLQRARHPGRHRGPAGRGLRRDHRHRPGPGHPRGRAGAHLRALLPGRRGPLARHRRHRPGPGDRQARLRQPRGPGARLERRRGAARPSR